MKTLKPAAPPLIDALPDGQPLALPGGSGLASVRAARAADPQPTWFRLTADSWAMIRAEYLAGATAKQLALKWRTSPTSIYRHACVEGWTKEGRARAIDEEAKARAGAEAAAQHRREAAAAQAEPTVSVVSETADGAEVAALALGAAARCIAEGRFVEAERLGKLAETLSRLAPGAGAVAGAGNGRRVGTFGSGTERETGGEAEKDDPFGAKEEPVWSPYESMLKRLEVEKRLERLAASFEKQRQAQHLAEDDDA